MTPLEDHLLLNGVDLAAEVSAHPGAKSPEQIADEVIDLIDAAIDWNAILPVVGGLIDAVDGPALKALVHAFAVMLAKSHPKRK